ncbi:MAG: polyribonucleotide nucleotidyltransferase [Chlamydiia bacterium]|nr:polyribonucleotide nucleotidyltransferase [Chlamydiia bacterium]
MEMIERKFKYVEIGEGKQLQFETGKIARQANGAVLVRLGETIVFTSVCAEKTTAEDTDFLPLRVDYTEKFSSAGKSLGGFIKREGRPTEKQTLVSRLIDRPLRPMFEEGYYSETQILSYVWSYDGLNQPDPLAICAASAALAISDIPLSKPIGGVRVGLIGDQLVINPTTDEMKKSSLDLMLAGTEEAILMIEGYADFLTEKQILEAISFGHKAIAKIAKALKDWQQEIGKPKNRTALRTIPEITFNEVKRLAKDPIEETLRIQNKQEREEALEALKKHVLSTLFSKEEESSHKEIDIKLAYKKVSSMIMRQMILKEKIRSDGRSLTEIRPIDIEIGLLPRAHGSCLFTRGETQTVAVCTLGGESMGQRYETLDGEGIQRFYLQYFFPPFSVGEVGRSGPAGRRELGHGKLAERALTSSIPSLDNFPYTIRLESNITESNGSSSMASVCGGCLALMEAGVPIKRPVSGIAMGLILDGNDFAILSDILGVEDALGDMDFKIAGDEKGISTFQMDIKVEGITLDIMEAALNQAKEGRIHILNKMLATLPESKKEMSIYAPRIETIQVKASQIGTIIGPGGKQIRSIIEETGVQIDINDSGLVSIASPSPEAMKQAKLIIEGLIGEIEIGKIYRGKISSVVQFGAFVELFPGREGLCHISELSKERVQDIFSYIKEGEHIMVKVLDINERGQIKLSRKATLAESS